MFTRLRPTVVHHLAPAFLVVLVLLACHSARAQAQDLPPAPPAAGSVQDESVPPVSASVSEDAARLGRIEDQIAKLTDALGLIDKNTQPKGLLEKLWDDVKSVLLNILSSELGNRLFGEGPRSYGVAALVVALSAFTGALLRTFRAWVLARNLNKKPWPLAQLKARFSEPAFGRWFNLMLASITLLTTTAALFLVVAALFFPPVPSPPAAGPAGETRPAIAPLAPNEPCPVLPAAAATSCPSVDRMETSLADVSSATAEIKTLTTRIADNQPGFPSRLLSVFLGVALVVACLVLLQANGWFD